MSLKNKLTDEIKTMQPRSYFQSLRKKSPHLISEILEKTSYLSEVKFNERILHILKDYSSIVICPICNKNKLTFKDINRGYSETCSYDCAAEVKRRTGTCGTIISESLRNKNFEKHLKLFLLSNFQVLTTKEEYAKTGVFSLKCNSCKKVEERITEKQVVHSPCRECSPRSRGQNEVFGFIKSIDPNVRNNDRKQLWPKFEIDIFVPEKRIGIEYNGLYWHSDLRGFPKTYHLDKTEVCELNNIHLLHIFENEWLDLGKQEIWKSIISGKLNLNNSIGARKCKIVDLTSKNFSEFLNENHLQGNCNSSIRLGLEFEGSLVCVLGIAKPRYNKKYDWEITRFANRKGLNVIGGFSKLLKKFRTENLGSLITYADKRYSNGDLYKKNGFLELEDSKPSYWYFKGFELYHRSVFQKHKLNSVLSDFSSERTEWENMKENGWNRIWDCGNKVFILER